MHPFWSTHLLNGCRSHFLPFFGYSPFMHTKHSLVINIHRQLLYRQQMCLLSRVRKSPHPSSSYMGHMQYAKLFKQRPQALASMIYFPFMTKIILYVQVATFCSHKISQNMGFFNKKPFEGPLSGGAMILYSGWGGHWHGGGGALAGGGGVCLDPLYVILTLFGAKLLHCVGTACIVRPQRAGY